MLGIVTNDDFYTVDSIPEEKKKKTLFSYLKSNAVMALPNCLSFESMVKFPIVNIHGDWNILAARTVQREGCQMEIDHGNLWAASPPLGASLCCGSLSIAEA